MRVSKNLSHWADNLFGKVVGGCKLFEVELLTWPGAKTATQQVQKLCSDLPFTDRVARPLDERENISSNGGRSTPSCLNPIKMATPQGR